MAPMGRRLAGSVKMTELLSVAATGYVFCVRAAVPRMVLPELNVTVPDGARSP